MILVLPNFPAPDSGSGQRSLMFLDAAAALGPVHIVLLTHDVPHDPAVDLPQAASVEVWGAGSLQLSGPLKRVPHGALRLVSPNLFYRTNPDFQDRLNAMIERTGARAVLFRYVPAFCATGAKKRDGLAVLVDVDDRDDQKYATRLKRMFGDRLGGSVLFRLPLGRLAGMMRRRLADASLIWFAGAEDAWTLPGTRSSVVPNVPMTVPSPDLPPPSQGDCVLFVGVSGHIPNQDGVRWFLDNCWPDLAKRFPGIRMRIVGRGFFWPSLSKEYPDLPQVDFVGAVDDLSAEYARARLCICPVREGGGSKIKVVEAAAFGRPVVGVPHAFRGFDAGILDHAAEALSPNDFTQACADFLTDADLADRAGAGLADWQHENYSRDGMLGRIQADIRAVSEMA